MVPFVNPVTVYDSWVDCNVIGVVIGPPDNKYPVIWRPPSYGALQLNVDCAFSLGAALKLLGALGTVDGVALVVAGDPGLFGFAFVAAT